MEDPALLLRTLASLVFVVALIAGAAFVLRAGGLTTLLARKALARRLHLVETLPLDARRRLVVVRRDAREYLLLLSPSGETLLEGGFPAPEPATAGDTPPPALALVKAEVRA